MSGQRQPIALVVAKGKKHLTKAEIEERQRTEVRAPADKVTAPAYLTPSQKKAFRKTVKELRAIDLISNLDVDALARLVIAQEKYREITEQIAQLPLMVEIEVQCRQGAADFGLTVSSRCRLIVPKAKEAPKQNNLDVIVFIINNSEFGIIRQWEESFYDMEAYQVKLENPDFVKIASGYGIDAVRVDNLDDLEMILDKELEGPLVVEVIVESEDIPLPH